MNLVHLIYASQVEKLDSEGVRSIIHSAHKNNPERGLTGYLFYNTEYFLQCLEGGRREVNNIFHKIAMDPRHSNIQLINYREIDRRAFSGWSMGYYMETQTKKETLLKYSADTVFNPYILKGESAHQYLIEISQIHKSL